MHERAAQHYVENGVTDAARFLMGLQNRPAAAVGAPQGEGRAAAAPSAAPPIVPFDQAAHRGLEPGPTWAVTPTAAVQTNGPLPLPAQGYLRRVIIDISSAGGLDDAGGVLGLDGVANILSVVRLQDTNGAPLCELSGYNLMLMDTYGRFAGVSDPRLQPDYSAGVITPSIQLMIPVEISPNGMGSLANQSAAAAYKLTLSINAIADIWSRAPRTVPDFTIRTYMDFWTLPAPQDMLGRQQVRTPPFNGTAQYFTEQRNNAVNTGADTTRITRTGNLIRLLGFVGRIDGARRDTPFPDPFTLNWDSRDLMIASDKTLRTIMREYVEELVARDTGVYFFNFSYGEGRLAGDSAISSWLPTVSATRLEVAGVSVAGTLDILVNDVSVAETDPAARAVETSATGYHPPVAPTVIGAQ